MKLVDILARELKVWPEKSVAAVKQNSTDDRVSFVDCMDVEFSMGQWDYSEPCMRIHEQKESHEFERADDWKTSIVTRAEWQAAVDALDFDKCEHSYANKIECPECGELNAPKVVEWDGVGRPPEGTVCGLWYKGCDQGECTVLFMGAEVGVFKSHAFDHEQHGDLVHYSFYKVENTTEEKDAQERKKAIAEMTEIAGGQYSPRDSIVQRLFDAGYRKEPKPCGS